MKVLKPLLAAFLVGGLFSLVGEGFTMLWVSMLGPDSLLLGFAILVSMGVVGAVMFILGWHQRVEKFGGIGAMLPFNGLCAAIANAYTKTVTESVGASSGIAASLKLVAYVLGVGCALIFVVALITFFVA